MAKIGNNTKDKCRHCGSTLVFMTVFRYPMPRNWDPEYMQTVKDVWFHADRVTEVDDINLRKCPVPEGVDPETVTSRYGEPLNYCGESTQQGEACNRPVQDRDVMACGIHAGPLREQKERQERMREERELAAYVQEVTEALVASLHKWGLKSAQKRSYRSDGMIEIRADELFRFLRGLGADAQAEDTDDEEDLEDD
jgi:hypothetical protein